MRKLGTLIFLCFSLCCSSQKPGQRNALLTIRGNIGLPEVISSKMFHTSFAGIYEGNLSVNLRVLNNFYMGIGYQNTQFQNNKFLKMQLYNASVSYNTRLMGHAAFVKIGYDQFVTDKNYVSYSVNTGYMLCSYNNVNADTSSRNQPFVSKTFSAPYIQPEISMNFGVEDNMSFCLMLSYTTLLHRFDARAPRFNQFEEIRKASNKYAMGWLAFGVGFNVLINKK